MPRIARRSRPTIGTSALESGDYDRAIEAFAEAHRARPNDILLEAWRAKAFAEAGQTQEAVSLLDRVIAARPSFLEARYNRAAYRARMGDFEGAAVDLTSLLAADRIRRSRYTAMPTSSKPDNQLRSLFCLNPSLW